MIAALAAALRLTDDERLHMVKLSAAAHAPELCPSSSKPPSFTLTRVVVPAARLRRKTSLRSLASFGTRSVAWLVNATRVPSGVIDELKALPGVREVVPLHF